MKHTFDTCRKFVFHSGVVFVSLWWVMFIASCQDDQSSHEEFLQSKVDEAETHLETALERVRSAMARKEENWATYIAFRIQVCPPEGNCDIRRLDRPTQDEVLRLREIWLQSNHSLQEQHKLREEAQAEFGRAVWSLQQIKSERTKVICGGEIFGMV